PPSSGRRSRPPGAGRARHRRWRAPGSDRGAECGRAGAHTTEPACLLVRPWPALPKRILRILVDACVLNLAGVPCHELRTPSYTTEGDGTAMTVLQSTRPPAPGARRA